MSPPCSVENAKSTNPSISRTPTREERTAVSPPPTLPPRLTRVATRTPRPRNAPPTRRGGKQKLQNYCPSWCSLSPSTPHTSPTIPQQPCPPCPGTRQPAPRRRAKQLISSPKSPRGDDHPPRRHPERPPTHKDPPWHCLDNSARADTDSPAPRTVLPRLTILARADRSKNRPFHRGGGDGG